MRMYGSEVGEVGNGLPYPYPGVPITRAARRRDANSRGQFVGAKNSRSNAFARVPPMYQQHLTHLYRRVEAAFGDDGGHFTRRGDGDVVFQGVYVFFKFPIPPLVKR